MREASEAEKVEAEARDAAAKVRSERTEPRGTTKTPSTYNQHLPTNGRPAMQSARLTSNLHVSLKQTETPLCYIIRHFLIQGDVQTDC